jgi:SAM-dependent methyltransferase
VGYLSAACTQVGEAAMPTAEILRSDMTTHAGAAFFCRELTQRGFRSQNSEPHILVAGCGRGHEAAAIGRHFAAHVDAIDVEMELETDLLSELAFQEVSVCEMPFDSESFDAVFYHHVIEHVDQPAKSLEEIHRVMKSNAWLFVGTPNRHRLVSSVGAHRQTEWEPTLPNKLKDNLDIWQHRLTGRFRNEYGAHAGFSKGELDEMLSRHFDTRIWLTREYFRFKYANSLHRSIVDVASSKPFCWFAAPSIYVLCRK